MKAIKNLVEAIDDELCGARDYAEKYVEMKAEGNGMWANRYKEMAQDEIKHAMYLHEAAVDKIEKLRTVYEPNSEMEDKWEKAHKEYVEKMAWIKMMLTM